MRTAAADRWRFDRKVVWSPTCLWWVGAIADDGYGRSATGTGRVMSAHRWLWEQDVGPLPATEVSQVAAAHQCPGRRSAGRPDTRPALPAARQVQPAGSGAHACRIDCASDAEGADFSAHPGRSGTGWVRPTATSSTRRGKLDGDSGCPARRICR